MALVPNELLGRVNSAAMTLAYGAMPIGSVGAGYLLQGVGSEGAVLVLSAGMLLIAVVATISPTLRHPPSLPASMLGDGLRKVR